MFPYGVTRYKKSIYLLCENMKNVINKQDLVLYMVAQLGTVSSQHQQTLIIPQRRGITGHITFRFFYHDALQCDRIIQKPCQFLLAPDEYLNHTIYPHYLSALICDNVIYLIKSYSLALFRCLFRPNPLCVLQQRRIYPSWDFLISFDQGN